MENNTKIPLFRRCVIQNFPFIEEDFDALTDYGLISKIVEYLNNVINQTNATTDQVEELTTAFNTLKDYVDHYFDNLDVQEEINNKLDDMAEDGTLSEILESVVRPYVNELNQNYTDFTTEVNATVQNQNRQIASLASGSPLVATSTDDMTDTTRTYVNTTDGKWYYYDGDSWEIGGTYQTAGVADNSITFNTLDDMIQDVFGYETFEDETVTWEENTYYSYASGNKFPTQYCNSTTISVTAGDIFHLEGYGTAGGVALYVIKSGSTVLTYQPSSNAKFVGDIIIPANADTLCINHIKDEMTPIIRKCTALTALSDESKEYINDAVNSQIKEITNGIRVSNPTYQFYAYFRPVFWEIPNADFAVSTDDVIYIDFDIKTDYKDKIFSGAMSPLFARQGTTGTIYQGTITDNGYKLHAHIEITAASTNPFGFWWALQFTESATESYVAYNIKIVNHTTSTTLTNQLTYVTADSGVLFPYSYSQIYEDNKVTFNLLGNNDIYKVVYCAGDSLTASNPNQNNSTWVTQLRKLYPDATIYNHAIGGSTSKDMVNQLTNQDRSPLSHPVKNPDYTNAQAVFINIGTNQTAMGSLATSIPQIANATDMNDQPLTNMDVAMAVDTGFKYNGNVIDSAQDYWDLFANDNYGNLGLCIEYIQWKNPKTQIFLCPPPVMPIHAMTDNGSAWVMLEVFKELAKFYGVNVIDTVSGININQKNSYHFSYDGVHGLPIRDQMYGQFVAKQCRNKIILE